MLKFVMLRQSRTAGKRFVGANIALVGFIVDLSVLLILQFRVKFSIAIRTIVSDIQMLFLVNSKRSFISETLQAILLIANVFRPIQMKLLDVDLQRVFQLKFLGAVFTKMLWPAIFLVNAVNVSF